GTLTSGSGSASVTFNAAGMHSVTARYTGGSATDSAPVDIDVHVATTTALSFPSPATAGQIVTLAATVAGAVTPTAGNVEFYDAGGSIGTGSVVSGVATLDLSFTTGSHPITAIYQGAGSFDASPVAPSKTLTVNPANSTTALTVPATITKGTDFTVTVTVSPSAATGTVSILNSGAVIKTGLVSGGTTTITLNLTPGTYSLTARYEGDTIYGTSTSAPAVSRTVAP
ncbi:MAG: Ig-like domain-containing protein, partial [Tepidiformaceae bacterium]